MYKMFHYGNRRSLSSSWVSKWCIKQLQTSSRHLRSSFRNKNIYTKFLSVRVVSRFWKWIISKKKFGEQIVTLEWTKSTSILKMTLKKLQLFSMMPVRVKLTLRRARSQVRIIQRLWWKCLREKSYRMWKNRNESLLIRKFFLNNLQQICNSRRSKSTKTSLKSTLIKNQRKFHYLHNIKLIKNCLWKCVNKKETFQRVCN